MMSDATWLLISPAVKARMDDAARIRESIERAKKDPNYWWLGIKEGENIVLSVVHTDVVARGVPFSGELFEHHAHIVANLMAHYRHVENEKASNAKAKPKPKPKPKTKRAGRVKP